MNKDEIDITPWHVNDDINYDKLINQFGTKKIKSDILDKIKEITGNNHFMLRRNIFFSHRDLNTLLNEYKSGNKFSLYTGRGPSGNTHIGHLLPWVFAKWIQDKFDVNMYFQISDDEKFLSRRELTLNNVQGFSYENALDFIALGFKPDNTKIIINTKHINILYPIALQIAKKINFSNIKAIFGFTNETNIGMIFYTALQSAPCFIENKHMLIPLGIDQDPHFRVCRDVAEKLDKIKPAIIHGMMMPSLHGVNKKMSTSIENSAIYTTDNPDIVKKKITKYAFSGGKNTISEHRKTGGNPEIDVAYQYMRMFFEPDDKKLKELHDGYKSGEILTGELKAIVVEKINKFLKTHQQKREKAKDIINDFLLA